MIFLVSGFLLSIHILLPFVVCVVKFGKRSKSRFSLIAGKESVAFTFCAKFFPVKLHVTILLSLLSRN